MNEKRKKQERKKERNIITETDKRNGTVHLAVAKRWPDGPLFRRRCLNLPLARNLLTRVNAAIIAGTWRELRDELTKPKPNIISAEPDLTVNALAGIYFEKYCKVHNARPDFKEETLEDIKGIVGDVRVKEFKRSDAVRFVEERSKQVAGATVNRGIAVLSNMMTFALDKGYIDVHPMQRFKRLSEPEAVLQVMTLDEERRLVEAVTAHDAVIGGYCALLGETGSPHDGGVEAEVGTR